MAAVFYNHWHNSKSDLGGHFNANICMKSGRKVETAIQNGKFYIEYTSVNLVEKFEWVFKMVNLRLNMYQSN